MCAPELSLATWMSTLHAVEAAVFGTYYRQDQGTARAHSHGALAVEGVVADGPLVAF